MKATGLALLALLLPLGLAGPLRAHTVQTADGTVYEGKIHVNDEEKVVILTTFDGRKELPKADVTAVDEATPPLREQLQYRANHAKDSVRDLWKLHKWAKQRGFEKELTYVLQRIVELEPKNVKAHKMLGHEKVDGRWMSPGEKADYEREAHEAAMRAKGLVFHEGK